MIVRRHSAATYGCPGTVPDAPSPPASEHAPTPDADTPRIVVAGGGVAGLEACLALRAFLGDRDLSIDLLCRESRFEYRPLTVLEPFEGAPRRSMKLERFAADHDVRLICDALPLSSPAGTRPHGDGGACPTTRCSSRWAPRRFEASRAR